MVRVYRIVLLVAAGYASAAAQTGSVVGKVVDAGVNDLPFAKLLLAGSPDSGTRDEVTADAKGQFRISGLALGNYTLTIRLQGFLDNTIRNVQITAVEPRDVGNIVLGFAGCFAPGVICETSGLAPRLSMRRRR